MWIWPVTKFWTFSPYGWCLAVLWNICEMLEVRMPFARHSFGVISGYKGKKREGSDD